MPRSFLGSTIIPNDLIGFESEFKEFEPRLKYG